MKPILSLIVGVFSGSIAAKADVEVQCQMGNSCVYQKVLSRTFLKHVSWKPFDMGDGSRTHPGGYVDVINARVRSCFKDFGGYNERTGTYPRPSQYSCKMSDDINTDYVIAVCTINTPSVGGLEKDGKWHLRQVVTPGTKHVWPDLITYFMICHGYEKGDIIGFARRLGYHLQEQGPWQEHMPEGVNATGQREEVYDNLDDLTAAQTTLSE
jgi:hypothetical protein